ncbi:hypothetical protein BaRGS_00025019 [Batillaria attramentaria]|uniref:Uncharacterized protein n=1 Tax=Batillaria attramentaria TaxID=370345 RepID=A0ABD0K9F6_9CAEN
MISPSLVLGGCVQQNACPLSLLTARACYHRFAGSRLNAGVGSVPLQSFFVILQLATHTTRISKTRFSPDCTCVCACAGVIGGTAPPRGHKGNQQKDEQGRKGKTTRASLPPPSSVPAVAERYVQISLFAFA